MTVYDYSQLEQLWDSAGGPQNLAPTEAAIAEAESSGNSQAYNASGASGLWQILGAVNPADQSNLFDPTVNAHEAVLKYNSQGLDAWETYTNGAYKQFLNGANVPAGANINGSTGTPVSATTTSFNPVDPTTWIPSIIGSAFSTLHITDILERGALMLFGAVLVIIGIVRMTEGGSKSSNSNKQAPTSEEKAPEAVSEAASEAAPEAEVAEVAA